MRERSSSRSSSDSSTLKGPRVFGAPIGEGESCLLCGTATVAKFLGDFPLPRKVNTRIVGMQTMCRESIGSVSDYAATQELGGFFLLKVLRGQSDRLELRNISSLTKFRRSYTCL